MCDTPDLIQHVVKDRRNIKLKAVTLTSVLISKF